MLRLAEIAAKIGGVVEGRDEVEITGVAGLREASEGDISFLASRKYLAHAKATRASAVIVAHDFDGECPASLVRVAHPDKVFSEVALLFAPPPVVDEPGIHPTALVAGDAEIGERAHIGPYCVIESGVRIGPGAVLKSHVYLGHGVHIGERALLYSHVSIRDYCRIGNRFVAHNGVVIGADGFGYSVDDQGVRTKIPQIGIVVIGDDVELGANVCVDRARFGQTRIGNGVKVDDLVMIAHNVVIGDHVVVVSQSGIAGSSMIGSKAILAGQCGITGHAKVGEGAIVGAQSGVTKDVPPGAFVVGFPAALHDKYARQQAHLARLPQLKAKVEELEARILRLEQ